MEIETGSGDIAQGGLDAHATATAVKLALHKYDWKTGKTDVEKKKPVNVAQLLDSSSGATTTDKQLPELDWKTGTVFAECQNLARVLMVSLSRIWPFFRTRC